MKVCQKCGQSYDSSQQFCNLDGTLLDSVAKISGDEKKNVSPTIYLAVGGVLLILIGVTFGWFFGRTNSEMKIQSATDATVGNSIVKSENSLEDKSKVEAFREENPSKNINKIVLAEEKYSGGTTNKADIANPEKFERIRLNQTVSKVCKTTIKKCGKDTLTTLGIIQTLDDESKGNEQNKDEEFYFQNGVALYLRTITGLADDSISGMRYRVAFKKNNGIYELIQVGKQQRCYAMRGSTRWTKDSCL